MNISVCVKLGVGPAWPQRPLKYIAPIHALLTDRLQVSLMHEAGRLQGLVRAPRLPGRG